MLNGTEWSACTTADFIVGTPGLSNNLVISEIMYNPQGPDELGEFIEIMNISPSATIDMTDVSFTDGITYTFPTGYLIAPLTRVVIVKDLATFTTIHGSGMTIAPGVFTGSLSNSGEGITLSAFDASPIQSFTFSDTSPWPSTPDGLGTSLVLNCPEENPNHTGPTSWRASRAINGNPGTSDATTIPSNPSTDLDADGNNALLEYFLGTSDTTFDQSPISFTDGPAGLVLTFPSDPTAEKASYTLEFSTDLSIWAPDPTAFTIQATTILTDGRQKLTFLLNKTTPVRFVRIKVQLLP